MKLAEEQIEFMRADLESNFAYKIIEAARKLVDADGRNFEQEFEKWKQERSKNNKEGR